jgi:hypothetical protein
MRPTARATVLALSAISLVGHARAHARVSVGLRARMPFGAGRPRATVAASTDAGAEAPPHASAANAMHIRLELPTVAPGQLALGMLIGLAWPQVARVITGLALIASLLALALRACRWATTRAPVARAVGAAYTPLDRAPLRAGGDDGAGREPNIVPRPRAPAPLQRGGERRASAAWASSAAAAPASGSRAARLVDERRDTAASVLPLIALARRSSSSHFEAEPDAEERRWAARMFGGNGGGGGDGGGGGGGGGGRRPALATAVSTAAAADEEPRALRSELLDERAAWRSVGALVAPAQMERQRAPHPAGAAARGAAARAADAHRFNYGAAAAARGGAGGAAAQPAVPTLATAYDLAVKRSAGAPPAEAEPVRLRAGAAAQRAAASVKGAGARAAAAAAVPAIARLAFATPSPRTAALAATPPPRVAPLSPPPPAPALIATPSPSWPVAAVADAPSARAADADEAERGAPPAPRAPPARVFASKAEQLAYEQMLQRSIAWTPKKGSLPPPPPSVARA